MALYNSHYQQCSNGHLRETSNIGRLAPVLLIGRGGEMPIDRHLPVVFAMSPRKFMGRYERSDADPQGKHPAEWISQPNHLNGAGAARLPALFHRIAILFCRHLSSSNAPFRHSPRPWIAPSRPAAATNLKSAAAFTPSGSDSRPGDILVKRRAGATRKSQFHGHSQKSF